jgi:signal transduction histidine kinase
MVGFTSDVTRRKIAEVQLAGEKRLLEMVATGQPLRDVLKELCTFVEEIAPDCHCGVNLIDWSAAKFQLPVTPTLPATYNDRIKDLPVESAVGPCGKAASSRTQVIVEDLESDPAWQESPFRPLALAHGVRSCWSTPIYSLAGRVLGTFAVYHDKPAAPNSLQQDLIAQVAHIASIAIERSQHEEALRRNEAFLAEGQKLARIGNFAWHVPTNKITWSEQLYRIYEFEVGVPITLDLIRTRVHPEDITLYEKMIEYAHEGGEEFEWQYRLISCDHSTKYLHAVAHATRDQDGQLEYIVAVQDITARRLSEEALDEARSELAHAARAMSLGVMTASIAHEVSQPLSGIITNASTGVRMLDAEPPNVDGAREIARRIIRDGNRASDVISRLRALFGKKEFRAESVDLNEAAQEVIALSQSKLQRGQVVLQTDLANNLPFVHGDRVQLQQVILNLLLNAADAMSDLDGPRQLTISSRMDGADKVQLSVSDVGVGFALGEAKKLFDAFYTTKRNGMGIGLSVSRSIIDRHHGRLWAVPNEGPGAIFSFSIPVDESSERVTSAGRVAEDKNKQVAKNS